MPRLIGYRHWSRRTNLKHRDLAPEVLPPKTHRHGAITMALAAVAVLLGVGVSLTAVIWQGRELARRVSQLETAPISGTRVGTRGPTVEPAIVRRSCGFGASIARGSSDVTGAVQTGSVHDDGSLRLVGEPCDIGWAYPRMDEPVCMVSLRGRPELFSYVTSKNGLTVWDIPPGSVFDYYCVHPER